MTSTRSFLLGSMRAAAIATHRHKVSDWLWLLVLLGWLLAVNACKPPEDATEMRPTNNPYADNYHALRLGYYLFYDARLSKHHGFACANCHDPARDFADPAPRCRNGPCEHPAPSIRDAPYKEAWMHDNRVRGDLWRQPKLPLTNPDEHACSAACVRSALDEPGYIDYSTTYGLVFGESHHATADGTLYDNLGYAFEAYMRKVARHEPEELPWMDWPDR